MLEAASTGRWPRTGLDLSSRRWIRRWLRLRRFRRMAFTRNPFLLELMLFGHIHQTPQNTKDFEFFSEFHPSEGETFAWLRPRGRSADRCGGRLGEQRARANAVGPRRCRSCADAASANVAVEKHRERPVGIELNLIPVPQQF